MADIVPTLFGLTPEAYQQAQSAQADKMALQYAELSPMQQAQFAIGRGAYQLGGAIGGALGAVDPELQMISTRNAIANQIDPTNPESMRSGIRALMQAGDSVGAIQLSQVLRQAESALANQAQSLAAARASLAQETKALREDETVVVGNSLINRRTGEVIYKPETKLNPVVVGNSLVDPTTGTVIYKPAEGEPRPVVVGNALVNPITGAVVYKAEKTESTPEDVKKYEVAKSEGFKGTFIQFLSQLAAAGRAPAQPSAPSITQIQDPTDPTRMITIDARRYQGGGLGSPGVIGASGKTSAAAASDLKKEQGISQTSNILDNLEVAYQNLDRLRAIPSTQRGVISNVLAGISASGPGQVAGRFAGTEEQTQRDIIQSARNQLFAAVKDATGLSAQNLNSNVEFTTWLSSLTDPSKSIQANQKIIGELRKFIESGGKYSAKNQNPQAQQGTRQNPIKLD
jgi:hypothetical protein